MALLAVAVAAGCAGPTRTGASLESLSKKLGGPKAGQTRVVVLRPKEFGGLFDTGWKVHLDGAPMGDLKTGTFVYRDIPAGPHQLTFERAGDFSRASHHAFTGGSTRTHVFRLEMNEKGRMVTAAAPAAGLVGLMVSSAVASAMDERGFFDFVPLEGAAAEQALAEIRLAD